MCDECKKIYDKICELETWKADILLTSGPCDGVDSIEDDIDELYSILNTCKCKCDTCEHNECFDCPVVVEGLGGN